MMVVFNVLNRSPTHFVSNICHQHRCHRILRVSKKIFEDKSSNVRYGNFLAHLEIFFDFPRVPFVRFRNLKIKYFSLELYGFDRRVIKLNFMKLDHQNRNFIIFELAMRIIFNYEENFEAFVTAKEGLA